MAAQPASCELFDGPATLLLLTWEDLERDLELVTEVDGEAAALGEAIDAAAVGLSARVLAPADAGAAKLWAALRSPKADEPLKLWLYRVVWDGKTLNATVEEHTLEPSKTRTALRGTSP